jgi:D-alanyl-lipoteichoic acid acyltransferase DltB (MBOAT superfamily)
MSLIHILAKRRWNAIDGAALVINASLLLTGHWGWAIVSFILGAIVSGLVELLAETTA